LVSNIGWIHRLFSEFIVDTVIKKSSAIQVTPRNTVLEFARDSGRLWSLIQTNTCVFSWDGEQYCCSLLKKVWAISYPRSDVEF